MPVCKCVARCICAPGLLSRKPSVRTTSSCYFLSYQQTVLLLQCGASLLQLVQGSQELRVLTHQETVVCAILKTKHKHNRG